MCLTKCAIGLAWPHSLIMFKLHNNIVTLHYVCVVDVKAVHTQDRTRHLGITSDDPYPLHNNKYKWSDPLRFTTIQTNISVTHAHTLYTPWCYILIHPHEPSIIWHNSKLHLIGSLERSGDSCDYGKGRHDSLSDRASYCMHMRMRKLL